MYQAPLEQQKFYISNVLKKPQRVTVRAFFTRVEQLNSFIGLLLSLYYSPRVNQATLPVVPFTEAELANSFLCMCPDSWQNQYTLSQETIPQDYHRLLIVLENIEKIGVIATATQKTNVNGNGNAKSNGKSDANGKHRSTYSSAGQYHKKKHTEKHCVLCQSMSESPLRTTLATVPSTRKTAHSSLCGAVVSTLPTRPNGSRMVIPTHSLRTAFLLR